MSLSLHPGEDGVLFRRQVPGLQSHLEFLPEDPCVLPSSWPAQVGASLHQPPHAVVGWELVVWDLLKKHQDQQILLLIKQKEAGKRRYFFSLLDLRSIYRVSFPPKLQPLSNIVFLNNQATQENKWPTRCVTVNCRCVKNLICQIKHFAILLLATTL